LGEVTAKLLAAGGADVTFTYLRGREDAFNIVEHCRAKRLRVKMFGLDKGNPEQHLKSFYEDQNGPSHLYFFATPPIFEGIGGRFSNNLFRRFIETYVCGFWRIYEAIRNLPSQLVYIFYSSTVAIDELPKDMGEYIAAKSAGEALCSVLQQTYPKLVIHVPRLPRMATDQTMSLTPVENQMPLPILLRELRLSLISNVTTRQRVRCDAKNSEVVAKNGKNSAGLHLKV
jgi:hypothetical protein